MKYVTEKDWAFADPKGYRLALERKLLPSIRHSHGWPMPVRWTLEECITIASNYSTRKEWKIKHSKSYAAAVEHKWLDQCCFHMTRLLKQRGYWTLKSCMRSALKFKTKKEWSAGDSAAYHAAHRLNIIDQCCLHMHQFSKPRGYYTKEKCIIIARQYTTRSEFYKHSPSAAGIAHKNGWMDKCCSHMIERQKPNGYWNFSKCLSHAKRYKSRKKWSIGHSKSYAAAQNKGWLDKCCKHMTTLRIKWSVESCTRMAKKFKTRNEWNKGHPKSYDAAKHNGWLDICCAHMKPKRIAKRTTR